MAFPLRGMLVAVYGLMVDSVSVRGCGFFLVSTIFEV